VKRLGKHGTGNLIEDWRFFQLELPIGKMKKGLGDRSRRPEVRVGDQELLTIPASDSITDSGTEYR
jgi:hypothetical protein